MFTQRFSLKSTLRFCMKQPMFSRAHRMVLRNFRTVFTEKVLCVFAMQGLFARNHTQRAVVSALLRAVHEAFIKLVAGVYLMTKSHPETFESSGWRLVCSEILLLKACP